MPGVPDDTIRMQAVDWFVKLETADEDQWLAFAAWLGEDPRHNEAYEAVADLDMQLAEHADDLRYDRTSPRHEYEVSSAPDGDHGDVAGSGGRLSVYKWPALAASIAAAGLVAFASLYGNSDPYQVATAYGETKVVTLGDGSRIALNGGTQITLDRDDARYASLDRGEAQFDVVHSPSDPFTLHVSNAKIVDVGTRFNVDRDGRAFSVEVKEGAVRYSSGALDIPLSRGETLHIAPDGKATKGLRDAAAMGGWMQGALQYETADYAAIATDLHRSTGIAVSVDPSLSDRSFTGVIQVGGPAGDVRRRVELLLGVTVRDAPGGWVIEP